MFGYVEFLYVQIIKEQTESAVGLDSQYCLSVKFLLSKCIVSDIILYSILKAFHYFLQLRLL